MNRLTYSFNKAVYSIRFDKIIYIERLCRKTYIYTSGKTFCSSLNLNEIAATMPDYFIRPHQSFIVNMNFISSLSAQEVLLDTDKVLPVSRSKAKEAKRLFLSFTSELANCNIYD